MMELIGKLIELALVECFDHGVIDWYPGEGVPETFLAEGEITYAALPLPFGNRFAANFYVFLSGIFCIIDAEHMECWHSSRLDEDEQVVEVV